MNRVQAEPQRCYDNALRALPYAPPGTHYVVGLWDAVANRAGVVGDPHCWLEWRGRVLEPSPPQLRALLSWGADARYHAVARYAPHEVQRACAEVRFWLFTNDHGPFACSDETLAAYFAG
jgi:hypothetical protein